MHSSPHLCPACSPKGTSCTPCTCWHAAPHICPACKHKGMQAQRHVGARATLTHSPSLHQTHTPIKILAWPARLLCCCYSMKDIADSILDGLELALGRERLRPSLVRSMYSGLLRCRRAWGYNDGTLPLRQDISVTIDAFMVRRCQQKERSGASHFLFVLCRGPPGRGSLLAGLATQ